VPLKTGGYIIVLGASAGGFQAMTQLLSKIPGNLKAALFVVLHISRESMANVICEHLQRAAPLNCRIPVNGEKIEESKIYLAPTDRHMLISDGKIVISHGPRENRWRPSIDTLFRSAASAYGSHVIGIILSGLLDDGTAGMSAIKRSGGICIVQEPSEAEFPDMPSSVLRQVDVDYRVPLSDIPYVIDDILSKPQHKRLPAPDDVKLEAAITERMASQVENMEKLGSKTPFICPDCGGSLWEIDEGRFKRYRCYTGHAYNQNVLLDKQMQALEESIWVSIRMMEERRNLLSSIYDRETQLENSKDAEDKKERADNLGIHIDRLKGLLTSLHGGVPKNREIPKSSKAE
jgi:two-component system chemotaxis response regulator CheB